MASLLPARRGGLTDFMKKETSTESTGETQNAVTPTSFAEWYSLHGIPLGIGRENARVIYDAAVKESRQAFTNAISLHDKRLERIEATFFILYEKWLAAGHRRDMDDAMEAMARVLGKPICPDCKCELVKPGDTCSMCDRPPDAMQDNIIHSSRMRIPGALKLSKRLPARTKTLTARWCKREFMVMDQKYREIRAKFRKPMDACHWCGHKIADGEMMGLACLTEGGNKILCQPCADELIASTVADWTVRMGDEGGTEEGPEIRTFSEATGVTTTFDEPLVSSEEWRWNIINEGLSNIWCGNEFLGCCATLEAKKICETHNASFGAREAKRRARPGNSVPSDFYQPDDLRNHRCSMDHPPCPACELLEEREHEREAGL